MLMLSMADRYTIRQERNGKWTVIDVFTGQPKEVSGRMMVSMELEPVKALIKLLNQQDWKRRKRQGIA
jgi:hypothetical protein